MKHAKSGIAGAFAVLFALSAWYRHPSSVRDWVLTAVEVLVPLIFIVLVALAWRRGKRARAAVWIAVLLLVEGNFSSLPYSLGLKEIFPVYRYISSDGGFSGGPCVKTPFCLWSTVEKNFAEYAQHHPGVRLLRREPMHVWQFWNWVEYAVHPRWRLDYAGSGRPESPGRAPNERGGARSSCTEAFPTQTAAV